MDENLAVDERAAFESQGSGFYNGEGQARSDDRGGRVKGFLKRKGPMGMIVGLLFGVGGLIGGAQMMQPFSLVEQFRETFNSMQTSTRTRSGNFLRYQMNGTKDPIRGRIFGPDTFKITGSQAKKLAAQGIEYDDGYEIDGKPRRVLKFDDGTGDIKIVVADADLAAKGGANVIDFDTLYDTNADFYNGYNKGSMTWRGAISNWFATMTVKFLQSNKITRNLFKNFQEKVQAANAGNTKTVAVEMMLKGADEIVEVGYESSTVDKVNEYEVTGEDGSKHTVTDVERVNANDVVQTAPPQADRFEAGETTRDSGSKTARAGVDVNVKLKSISEKMQKGANIACTVFNVLGGISLMVTASEVLQVVNLVTSYLEAIDKVKAGNGDDSPIHDLTNSLNENKTNTNTVLTSTGAWSSNEESNFTGGTLNTIGTKEYTTNKSAMESSGIVALYGGGAVNPNDPSVQSFNFSGSLSRILGGLGTSLAMFETCAIAKIAVNTASAVLDAIEVAGCLAGAISSIFTFGVSLSACGPLLTNVLTGIAVSVAIGVTVAGVISAITPMVANMLTRDLISNLGGEDLGNALTSGANIYMGNTHRANGGSLANKDKYVEFAAAQQSVIADNAKFERQNRDPFDMSSKYTFMGTIANQLMKFSSVSSLMSVVTSVSSTMSSSLIAMSPTASAYDIVQDLPDEATYKETCPYLWSIGAVGDAFCNPYSITDMSTITVDPVDVINRLNDPNGDGNYSDSNFLSTDDPDGNVKIDGKSDLAKYILYCDNRTSSFGVVDQNIAGELSSWGTVNTGSSFVNNATNSAIGAIPVIGDIIDIVGDSESIVNIGYIGGESCVAGNNGNWGASPNWQISKYYQRFIEDQSLAETMGLFGENGKSAVTAFLDEYYEEHPLDNSYEGILARYSGLPKDDVIALLDFIDYSVYVANYDPSERYAFGAEESIITPDNVILFENENKERFYDVWWYNIVYDRVGAIKARAEKAEYTIC